MEIENLVSTKKVDGNNKIEEKIYNGHKMFIRSSNNINWKVFNWK